MIFLSRFCHLGKYLCMCEVIVYHVKNTVSRPWSLFSDSLFPFDFSKIALAQKLVLKMLHMKKKNAMHVVSHLLVD